MKITQYLSLAIASVAIAASQSAFAQGPAASASPTTIALTITSQAESTTTGTEASYTTTLRTATPQRIGNKEILQLLVGQGVINNIDGWTIAYVVGGEGDGEFFLTKTGKEPRFIDRYLRLGSEEQFYGSTLLQTGTVSGRSTETSGSQTATLNQSAYGSFSVHLGSEFPAFFITGNIKRSVYYLYSGGVDIKPTYTYTLNSHSLLNGVGATGYFGPSGMVQGSITGTKGVPFTYFR